VSTVRLSSFLIGGLAAGTVYGVLEALFG